MGWNVFDSREVQGFAKELAVQVLADVGNAADQADPKFRRKAEQALKKAARRIDGFKAEHRLNWFQRSRAANAFLWALKDRQCAPAYAEELTEWFVLRL